MILNAAVVAVVVASMLAIGESADAKTIALLFLSYFLMQLQIAAITFGLSAFIKRGGLGIGFGVAIGFYFLNIVANLTEELEWLKWITPFGYADGAAVITDEALNVGYLGVGLLLSVVGIAAAYLKYNKKDIVNDAESIK